MPSGVYPRSPEYLALLAERLLKRQTAQMKANAAAASRLARPPQDYPYHGLKAIHRERAEAALGKPLPAGAVVHHVDGTKNPASPLVICQDDGYHNSLHRRLRVQKAGGNPWTDRICSRCKAVKSKSQFHRDRSEPDGISTKCAECRNTLQSLARARKQLSA